MGGGGQFGERGGQAADFVAGRLGVDGVGVQLGFDGPGARSGSGREETE